MHSAVVSDGRVGRRRSILVNNHPRLLGLNLICHVNGDGLNQTTVAGVVGDVVSLWGLLLRLRVRLLVAAVRRRLGHVSSLSWTPTLSSSRIKFEDDGDGTYLSLSIRTASKVGLI